MIMNKPSKCKNCQWYGKPYWSIINPCDNCPMENVETFVIKQDNTGIRVGNFATSTSTGKIILNGVEITDIDTFNKAVDTFKDLQNEIQAKDKEIERLNNVINELEKWLEESKSGDISFAYIHTLDKLKELKENNK